MNASRYGNDMVNEHGYGWHEKHVHDVQEAFTAHGFVEINGFRIINTPEALQAFKKSSPHTTPKFKRTSTRITNKRVNLASFADVKYHEPGYTPKKPNALTKTNAIYNLKDGFYMIDGSMLLRGEHKKGVPHPKKPLAETVLIDFNSTEACGVVKTFKDQSTHDVLTIFESKKSFLAIHIRTFYLDLVYAQLPKAVPRLSRHAVHFFDEKEKTTAMIMEIRLKR